MYTVLPYLYVDFTRPHMHIVDTFFIIVFLYNSTYFTAKLLLNVMSNILNMSFLLSSLANSPKIVFLESKFKRLVEYFICSKQIIILEI